MFALPALPLAKSAACGLLLTLFATVPASAQRPLYGGGFGYGPPPSTSFKPGGYVYGGGGTFHNPATGAAYLPGRAVVKGSGIYTPAGGGYYRNPHTGNVYNPRTGAYKSPH